MPPNRETLVCSYTTKTKNVQKPPNLSMEGLQRTMSDISLELRAKQTTEITNLPPITEVEEAKCECCGMSEECTNDYINRVRGKFSGKLVCGLCAEAVTEEMVKNGGKREEALEEHVRACVRFNSFDRTHPVLYQAEVMREMFKKSCTRAKSVSPRDNKGRGGNKGGIARSSSCIPTITKETRDGKMVDQEGKI